MSRFVRNYRIRNGIQLAFLLFSVLIFVIFRNSFIEVIYPKTGSLSNDKISFIIFCCCACFVVIIMLFLSIRDTFKSKDKIIKEKIDILTNTIKYYKKHISELEEEIDKLK